MAMVPETLTHSLASAEPTKTIEASSPPQKQAKLHGRAFYEAIGSPKFILAPMVDQSEFVS
jgi:tRNA-dihydrouridine synthase 1